MKAVIHKKYGGPEVLQIVEVAKPSPKDNEVLVKISATTVTATEATFRKGKPYFTRLFTGIFSPKIETLGEEIAGKIESIGKDVDAFKIGDKVFGTAGPEFGGNAEYLCVAQNEVLTAMPKDLSYEEAASSVDGFLTALPFLRDTGNIKSGDKVLIYGASGSVGVGAVQVAKIFGAKVTAVCSHSNFELVKSIGADEVINYKKDDFTKNGEKYDIIFDTVGKITFSKSKVSLSKQGVFLEAGISIGILPHVILSLIFPGKKAKIAATGLRLPKERKKDLILLKGFLESKKIIPVIDKQYDLNEISDAHAYVDLGHKKGNVTISIG